MTQNKDTMAERIVSHMRTKLTDKIVRPKIMPC